jgi:hypothetical protein
MLFLQLLNPTRVRAGVLQGCSECVPTVPGRHQVRDPMTHPVATIAASGFSLRQKV